MYPVSVHIPSAPKSENPPHELVEALESFQNSQFQQVGLTCTTDGLWAVLMTVPAKTEIPLLEIERFFAPFPVIYEAESEMPFIPYRSDP